MGCGKLCDVCHIVVVFINYDITPNVLRIMELSDCKKNFFVAD